jgi:hypothetical protein
VREAERWARLQPATADTPPLDLMLHLPLLPLARVFLFLCFHSLFEGIFRMDSLKDIGAMT